MIAPQELRIGNFLQYMDKDIAIVEFVSGKHFDCRTKSGFFTPNGEYEPIELTEDWLFKFGFRKTTNGIWVFWSKETGLFEILESKPLLETMYRFFSGSGTIGNCLKYVHQLQNLIFALTGEELKIKE